MTTRPVHRVFFIHQFSQQGAAYNGNDGALTAHLRASVR